MHRKLLFLEFTASSALETNDTLKPLLLNTPTLLVIRAVFNITLDLPKNFNYNVVKKRKKLKTRGKTNAGW